MLLFLLLRDLRARAGFRDARDVDDLWLTAMFGVGSVYYFCSVVGQVWFTAQIVGVTLSIGYAGRRSRRAGRCWPGLFVALGFATRPPWLVFPLFLFEAVRVVGRLARRCAPATAGARCAAPAAVRRCRSPSVGSAAGCAQLRALREPVRVRPPVPAVQWQDRIFRFGLFNYHFLSRNLAGALVLLPRIMNHYPYVQDQPARHEPAGDVAQPGLHRACRRSAAPSRARSGSPSLTTALPSLLYQNSGYVQFGYRFSLDYMIFLMVLLAIGNRPLTRCSRRWSSSRSRSTCSWRSSSTATWSSPTTTRFFPHGNN